MARLSCLIATAAALSLSLVVVPPASTAAAGDGGTSDSPRQSPPEPAATSQTQSEPEREPKPEDEVEVDPPTPRTAVSIEVSARRVQAHDPVRLTGTVTGPRREVQVIEKLPSGWEVVGQGQTDARGRYDLEAPTDWYGNHRYAVRAPETASHQAGTSRVRPVKVRAGYRPAGSPKSWSFLNGPNMRFRFDPCQTVTFRVNPHLMPTGALRDVKGSFRRISEATGMQFRYLGRTTAKGWADRQGKIPTDADVLIAWSRPEAASQLGTAAGIGGPLHTSVARDAQGPVWEIGQAAVLLSTDLALTGGFGRGPRYGLQGTRGQLLMHEIAHALGVGHTSGAGQIMRPVMSNIKAQFGAGDLVALSKIGMAAGCVAQDSTDQYARASITLPPLD